MPAPVRSSGWERVIESKRPPDSPRGRGQRMILVPVDGSTTAEAALPLAVAIGKKMGAEVRLALVREASSFDAQAYMDNTAEWVRERLAGGYAAVSAVILEGDATSALCVEAEAADFVVMSTHGHGGFERMWLGSVTDRLLRRASASVIVVKPGWERAVSYESIEKIVVPLDGSDLAERAAASAVALAGLFGASVTLFRVVSPAGIASVSLHDTPSTAAGLLKALKNEARRYLESVRKGLTDLSCTIDVAVGVERSPASGILHFVRERRAGMIVMTAQTRRHLSRVFLGSVTDKVVRGSPVPVLVVRGGVSSPE